MSPSCESSTKKKQISSPVARTVAWLPKVLNLTPLLLYEGGGEGGGEHSGGGNGVWGGGRWCGGDDVLFAIYVTVAAIGAICSICAICELSITGVLVAYPIESPSTAITWTWLRRGLRRGLRRRIGRRRVRIASTQWFPMMTSTRMAHVIIARSAVRAICSCFASAVILQLLIVALTIHSPRASIICGT